MSKNPQNEQRINLNQGFPFVENGTPPPIQGNPGFNYNFGTMGTDPRAAYASSYGGYANPYMQYPGAQMFRHPALVIDTKINVDPKHNTYLCPYCHGRMDLNKKDPDLFNTPSCALCGDTGIIEIVPAKLVVDEKFVPGERVLYKMSENPETGGFTFIAGDLTINYTAEGEAYILIQGTLLDKHWQVADKYDLDAIKQVSQTLINKIKESMNAYGTTRTFIDMQFEFKHLEKRVKEKQNTILYKLMHRDKILEEEGTFYIYIFKCDGSYIAWNGKQLSVDFNGSGKFVYLDGTEILNFNNKRIYDFWSELSTFADVSPAELVFKRLQEALTHELSEFVKMHPESEEENE